MIAENVKIIQEKMGEAADKSGQSYKDITLVGVTKTVSADKIQKLLDLGVTNIGENRVQEMMAKVPILNAPKPHWHMIGHLQTNKVKYIVDTVCLIQSVDSLKLSEEISKRAKALGIVVNVLAEVNSGGELTKNGVAFNEVLPLIESLSRLPGIAVKGLMTMPPFVENPAENRDIFKKMRCLFVDISEKVIHNVSMEILSMGMTNDYSVAIEEGSNMIRIGTGIFGER